MIFSYFNVIIILGDNMKKGFTLIELLGVIALIGILSLITIPVIDRSINQGKNNLYDIQEKQLFKSLKNYYAEHTSELNSLPDETTCKTVGELQNLGYLSDNLKDPKTNKDIDGNLRICVTKEKTGDNPKYVYFIEG